MVHMGQGIPRQGIVSAVRLSEHPLYGGQQLPLDRPPGKRQPHIHKVAGGPVGRVDPPIQGPAHRGFDQPAGQILLHGGASFLPGFPPGKGGCAFFQSYHNATAAERKGTIPAVCPKRERFAAAVPFLPNRRLLPHDGDGPPY